MLEKALIIVKPSAGAAASADDECRSFGSFISNKLRNYLPRTRNKVKHEISNITFAADQGHFDVSYPASAHITSCKWNEPDATLTFTEQSKRDPKFHGLQCRRNAEE